MIKTLSQLERNLGYKLHNNIVCVGIDTATKSGIAIVQIVGTKVKIQTFTLKIPALPSDMEEKTEKYEQHLKDFSKLFDKELISKIPNIENKILVLEQSFLKVNVVTFGFLRALQGILYEKLYKQFNRVILFFPVTARKLVGFHSNLPKKSKTKDKKKEIMKWISNVIQEDVLDDNIADALLLVFAALKK